MKKTLSKLITASLIVGMIVMPGGSEAADWGLNILLSQQSGVYKDTSKLDQSLVFGVCGKADDDESVKWVGRSSIDGYTDKINDGNIMLAKTSFYTRTKKYFVLVANINPIKGVAEISSVSVHTDRHAMICDKAAIDKFNMGQWNKYLMYVDMDTHTSYAYVNGEQVVDSYQYTSDFGALESQVRLCFNGTKDTKMALYIDDVMIYETDTIPDGVSETAGPKVKSSSLYVKSADSIMVTSGTTAAEMKASNPDYIARIYTDSTFKSYADDSVAVEPGMVLALENATTHAISLYNFVSAIPKATGDIAVYAERRRDLLMRSADSNISASGRQIVYKALSMLYLGKDIDEANGILCSDYVVGAGVGDEKDGSQLYWAMPALTNIYYMFGRDAPLKNVALSEEAEAQVERKLYDFLAEKCEGQLDEDINPLRVPMSENHNMLIKTTSLLISAKLKDREKYKNLVLPCGDSVGQYHTKLRTYLTQYLDFMVKNAVTVEGADIYVSVTLENVYNLYGLTDDETLKKQAKTYLDLYWIKYASESIDLIKGGAKSRCYMDWADTGENWLYALASAYFGNAVYSDVMPLTTPLVVNYYPPAAARMMIKDPDRRGSYEYIERDVGVGNHIEESVANDIWPVYYYDKDERITRYSYVTPDYVIGSFVRDPNESYTLITSQNQFEGVVLNEDKRIYAYADIGSNIHNAFLSMQKGDVLITQRTSSTGNLGIHISDLEDTTGLTYENGWYFGEMGNAYYAIRLSEGDLVSVDSKLLVTENRAMLVLRLARQRDYDSYEDFIAEISSNFFRCSDGVLEYSDSKWGTFRFAPDASENIRMLNGAVYGDDCAYTVKSPFSQQMFKTSVFTITQGIDYKWDLDRYIVSPAIDKREYTIADIKIYGFPSAGNMIYAETEVENGHAYYDWFCEDPISGQTEFICGGTDKILFINEDYENLYIKVRCSIIDDDFCEVGCQYSESVRVRGKRKYCVNQENWIADIITACQGDASTEASAGSVLINGGTSTSSQAKVTKPFTKCTSTTVIEFDAQNSGGPANLAYINGTGGTGININIDESDKCTATFGDGNGGRQGVTVRQNLSGETIHFKIIITPEGVDRGTVSLLVDGVLKFSEKSLRQEIADVSSIYFMKTAETGTLRISGLMVYTVEDEIGAELSVYRDTSENRIVRVINDSSVGGALIIAYYEDKCLLKADIIDENISRGISYYESAVNMPDNTDCARLFLLDSLRNIRPLSSALNIYAD